MTVEPGDDPTAEPSTLATLPGARTVAVLRATSARIRRDPVLVVPFVVAGLLVALTDRLRQWDPIPATTPDSFGQTISVQYSVFPRGIPRTIRRIGAFIDLELPFLVGAVALELVVVLAIGIAGWVTITRALNAERRLDSLARYLGLLSVTALLPRLFGSPTLEIGSLPLGVLAIVVAALVGIHLFLFPGYVAAGESFATALQRSVRDPRGRRSAVFWLIVLFGFAAWGLAQVPVAGGFLSTAVVAPVQAVSIAVLIGDAGSAVTASRHGD
ncbi:hypothetical protein [Natrinema soli]|uniref:Yip1 domain-containing protein n=1 Tax=Natrinema soli TaxID=1930624 RepID=A0ABD5SPH8_9EURY|nr:hypothetical protein [Natrinema soli]